MGPNPRGVVRCCHMWKPDPLGACVPGPALGAWISLPSGEQVRCRHVPLRKRLLSQLCHMSGGSQPSAGRQPNYRIKCGWVGCVCPGQACLLPRQRVTSQRRVREQRVIMICCRRAAACTTTVCAEATAQQVNIAPSPVSRN
jgi:hypothetical protein